MDGHGQTSWGAGSRSTSDPAVGRTFARTAALHPGLELEVGDAQVQRSVGSDGNNEGEGEHPHPRSGSVPGGGIQPALGSGNANRDLSPNNAALNG